MTDIQTLRSALVECPMSTAEELAAVLGWELHRTRRIITKLLQREELASSPKRYELTAFGAQRSQNASLTDEERAERRRQKVEAYNQGRRKELAAIRREGRRLERLARKAAAQEAKPRPVRVRPEKNDAAVAAAIAARHPLAKAWGGACNA